MKKSFLPILSILVLLSACQQTSDNEDNAPADETRKLVAYVSNYPLYFFTERIGGATVETRFPSSLSPDPAYWRPIADTVIAMQAADLVILNGASYEQWLMNASLPAGKVVVTSSPFTDRLIQSGGSFTHSHGPEGEHEHTGTASTTWLDLSLAALQAESIKDALLKQRPENSSLYVSNFNTLAEELGQLHQSFIELNAGESDVEVVYSHPVYEYLQKAYGVNGSSLHWEPDEEFDHNKKHELEHLIKDHGISCVIWESQPKRSMEQAIAKMGLQSLVFDPCANMPSVGDFLTVMQKNLETLRAVYDKQEVNF